MSPAQLPLAFGHSPSLAAEDFLVAGCNQAAHAWVGQPGKWSAGAAILYGPPGCGKTHLAHLFAHATGGCLVEARRLGEGGARDVLAATPSLVVEDCDRPGLDAVALFHVINQARELGRPLLLTARTAPIQWRVELADLRSRLLAMPAQAIGAPDDQLLAALLVKLFTDRQLRVGEDVLAYLLGRMERSFAAGLALVERLDAAALAGKRAITVPLARQVLEQWEMGHGSGDQGA